MTTNEHAGRRQISQNEHPNGPEWVARQNRAAARNERVDDGVNSSRHGRRCLTEAVDGACVCR
jgi:hypothetical protein